MLPLFTKRLLHWNKKENQREMPWKGEKDPYRIWLSEIILQQTRVEQGWNYYLKFIAAFPSVAHLAGATETKVFKLWEGLGYYSRCKNLIAAARIIDKEFGGRFPNQYEEILSLPGIGPYTAAAIASFAYNLPYAVVDGNVQRVLARYAGITIAVDSAPGRTAVNNLAVEWLDKKRPGEYNQAIMDFGALVCKPKSPACSECMLKNSCRAYQLKRVAELPVRQKKIVKKSRWLYYFLVWHQNQVYIRKRTGDDIWQNLHEFFLVEETSPLSKPNWHNHPSVSTWFNRSGAAVTAVSKLYTRQLTHQTLHGQFIEVTTEMTPCLGAEFKAIPLSELDRYPFPKFIITYLQEKNVNLSQH